MEKVIAVLIVMVVINLFMVFAVKKAAVRADQTIRRYFIEKMVEFGFMDGVVSNTPDGNSAKTQNSASELSLAKRAEDDEFEKSADKHFLTDAERRVINYKNIDFRLEYKSTKGKLMRNKRSIITEVISRESLLTDSKLSTTVENIKRRFTFDLKYNISTLSPERQLTLFREILLRGEQYLLDKYLDEECEARNFSGLDFLNYIEQLSYISDEHFYVKTGWYTDDFNNIDDMVVTIHDSTICEGLKIVHQNRLYDYSI